MVSITGPLICIPARMASKRLPGKPLIEVRGKPLIRHVLEPCLETGYKVAVLSDTDEIKKVCPDVEVIVSDREAFSGSQRVAFLAEKLDYEGPYINVQCDQIGVRPELIRAVGRLSLDTGMATAYGYGILGGVRVLVSDGFALDFHRSALGYPHIGIYGYSYMGLFCYLHQRAPVDLEQTIALDAGRQIRAMGWCGELPTPIDTPEDVERANA